MPKVSIVVPVYNVEKYLRQCLDSIINQTFKDIEIICINDCTPDNSQRILEEYAKKDNRISIVVNEENLGLGRTRNKSFNYINSDYVLFVDSDDWLELNAVEVLYEAITSTDSNIAYFNYRDVHEDTGKIVETILKNVVSDTNLELEDKKVFTNKDIRNFSFRKIPNLSWFKLYKKSFLVNNNIYFAPYKFEDQIFSIKAKILSDKNVYVDKILYNYRIQQQSIMRTSQIPFFEIYNDIKNLLIELNLHEELSNVFDEYVIQTIVFSMKKMSLIEKLKFRSKLKKTISKKQFNAVKKSFIRYILKDIFWITKEKKVYK